MENFNIEYIRYNGLMIGTKIYAKNLHIKSLINKPGTIINVSKTYKRFCNGEFIVNSQEFDEWYLNTIVEINDNHYYNKKDDEFLIKDEIYKFYGYSFGCEFDNLKGTRNECKTLIRISWDNIKIFIPPESEEEVFG